jgi:cytochrome c553
MYRPNKISFPAYFVFFFSILLFASFVHARDEGITAEAPLGEYVGSQSCEACHGPGKNHLENQKKDSIRIPGKNDGKNVLETCRRCHNNRKNHARAIQNFSGKFHR